MANFVNLTPHIMNIKNVHGEMVDFPPSGKVARVSEIQTPVHEIDGFQIVKKSFGEVIDLPDPVEGTFYVVSSMVQSACPYRADLVSPGKVIRDSENRPCGSEGFGVL